MREDADLTQGQISSYLNCSQQAYSKYELGQRDIPISLLIKLSNLYKTSVDYLLGLTNIKSRTIDVRKHGRQNRKAGR